MDRDFILSQIKGKIGWDKDRVDSVIREKAQEIYRRRVDQHQKGDEVTDWLEAERETFVSLEE